MLNLRLHYLGDINKVSILTACQFHKNSNYSYEYVNLLTNDFLEGANLRSQKTTDCTSEECCEIDILSDCYQP